MLFPKSTREEDCLNSDRAEMAVSRLGLINADCFGRSASILLDLSAALDMTDHSSLEDKLRNFLDICGTIPH